MDRVPSLARSLLALSVCAAPVGAAPQVDTPFWADEHLEGYVDAANSRWHDLYRLEEFARYDGQRLGTPERYAELQRRWAAERERVAAEIRALEADPERRFLLELDQRLARHPYFRGRELDRVDRHAPVHFLVQRAGGAREGLDNWVSNEFGPWLAEFDRVFEEEYVVPEELEAGHDHGAIVVAVLPTEGDYMNYANVISDPSLKGTAAHYDFDLEIAVIHTDTSSDPRRHVGRHERRRPVLHEMAHRLQHIWYTGTGFRPRQVWFLEGFAEYFSHHLGHTPESLRDHPIDTQAVQLVTPHAERGSPYVLPLEPLFAARTYGDALQSMARRAQEQGTGFDPGLGMAMLYAQSNLLMHYLHHGLPEGYEDVGRAYVAAALRGRGGLGELRKLLRALSVEDVERGFVEYLSGAYDAYVDRRLGNAADATGEGPSEAAAPALDPSALAPAPDDLETAFALAVLRATEGDLDGAEAALVALTERASASGTADRIERELVRVRGFRALLLEFLRSAADSRKRVPLTLDGETVNARVERVDAEGVVLESIRLDGERRFALADLDHRELCRAMGERKFRFDATPLCAWPWAASGAGAVPADARVEGAGAAELWADAERDYPARARAARAARRLAALAAAGEPGDDAEAEAALATVRELLAEAADLPLVADRRVHLRALAARALERRFEAVGLEGALRGRLERLGDGRVRLVYDFTDPAELADFSGEPYADLPRFAGLEDVPAGEVVVADGALVVRGATFLRHPLPLEGPFTVRCDLHVPDVSGELPSVMLGCCDDGAGACVLATVFGGLISVDPRRPPGYDVTQVSPPSQSFELTVEHDGEGEIRTRVAGVDASRLGTRHAGGGLFLWSLSAPTLEIRELALEGAVPAEGRTALRERWVAAELVALGLE